MIAAFMKARARPGKKEKLVEFLKWDGQVARDEEPATLRFDVYEDPTDPDVVYFYEAYVDMDGFEAHKRGAPFQKLTSGLWDECVESLEPVIPGWTTAVWPPSES